MPKDGGPAFPLPVTGHPAYKKAVQDLDPPTPIALSLPLATGLTLNLDGKAHSAGLSLCLTWTVLEPADLRLKGVLVSRKMDPKVFDGVPRVTRASTPLCRITVPVYVRAYHIEKLRMYMDLVSCGEAVESDEPEPN